MNLHPDTLIVVTLFSTLLMGGALLAISRDAPGQQIRGLAQWGKATLMQAAGWMVVGALRGVLPDVISIVAGNALILSSLSWYLLIVAEFNMRRVPVLPIVALIFIEAGLLFYFSAVEKSRSSKRDHLRKRRDIDAVHGASAVATFKPWAGEPPDHRRAIRVVWRIHDGTGGGVSDSAAWHRP